MNATALRRAVAVWAVGCACAASASAQNAAGTIKRLDGSARIVDTRGGERQAAVGEAVHAGDRLATGRDSALGMTLADGTLLSIGPNASLSLQNFSYDPTTREGSVLVAIARGAMRMVSGLIARSDPRQVRIQTPTATVGIRGTDVIVDVGEADTKR